MSKEEKNEKGTEREERAPGKRRNITRRGLLALAGGSVMYQLLSPCTLAWGAIGNPYDWAKKLAGCAYSREEEGLACADSGNGNYFWNRGASGHSEGNIWSQDIIWKFSYYSDADMTAMLGAGMKSEVTCIYENALYSFVRFRPLAQAYSRAPYTDHFIGWNNSGSDNLYRLVVRLDQYDGAHRKEVANSTCDFNLDTGGANTDHNNNASDGTTREIYFENEWIANDGARDWYERWSDYEDWGNVTTATLNLRRGYGDRSTWYQEAAEYWNFYCNIHPPTYEAENGGWGRPYNDDTNLKCYMDRALEQKLGGLEICKPNANGAANCGIEWAGRIVAVLDGGSGKTKALTLGDGRDACDRGTWLRIWKKGDTWPDATSRLNRSWYVHLNTSGKTDPASWVAYDVRNGEGNKWLGTMSFLNVMQWTRGKSAFIDQNTNGYDHTNSYGTGFTAENYWSNGASNQAFWIHTATVGGTEYQYIICDASGFMLEHAKWVDEGYGAGNEVGDAGWHTEGCGLQADLDNANHRWQLVDVIFKHRTGGAVPLPFTEVDPRETVNFSMKRDEVNDNDLLLESNTYPFVDTSGGYTLNSTQLRYEGMWVTLDETADSTYLSSSIHVEGLAYLRDYGNTMRYKPANNMLGAHGLKFLEGMKLRLAGVPNNISGGIAYRFRGEDYSGGDIVTGSEDWTEANGHWETWKTSDQFAGSTNNANWKNSAFQAVLYGEVTKYFTLRYAASDVHGWSGWRDEGYICIAPQQGAIADRFIQAIRIEVVPRAKPLDKAVRSKGDVSSIKATSWAENNKGPFSADGLFCTVSDMELGKKVVGVARAVVPDSDAYDNPTYLGYVRTTEVKPIVPVAIHFIADGEEVYKEPAWPLGTPYTISSSIIEKCTRPTGTLDKWYTDASYSASGHFTEDSFTPSDVNKRDYYIYCRNKYTVRFAFADDTRAYFGEHAPYAEEALSTRIYESAADEGLIMVPSAVERWHGDALGTLAWHRTAGYVARTDAGGAMKAIAVQSVFGESSATEASRPVASSTKVKASATLYVVWKRPTYDGFDSN